MIKSIKKFEKETNFQIQPFIQSKKDFDIIKGFHQSFIQYKTEISRIEKTYTDFFNGIGYDKIEPEYMRVVSNVSWFLDIITEMKKHYLEIMTPQDKTDYSDYMLDICETQNSCNNYFINNRQNFDLYNGYFIKLESTFGFKEEEYITFKEYKDNYSEIEKYDNEAFRKWVNAERICGKLGNR